MTKIAFALVVALSKFALGDGGTIPITDQSAAGNPLENRGECKLSETGTEVSEVTWLTRNAAQKPIVAYVETLTVRFSNGHSQDTIRNWESFFQPQVMMPGDEIPLHTNQRRQFPAPGYSPPRSSPASAEPTCEVNVHWVQFLDSTAYGDKISAKKLLSIREATLTGLLHLADVYDSEGLQGFAEELKKPVVPPLADAYMEHLIEHLRQFQKLHGDQAALEQMQNHIKIATERAQLMR
jgi:hypothetical protein